MRKIIVALLSIGLLAGVLAGCSESKAFANQCVFITGDGLHDSGRVKRVLYPGDRIDKGDDEDWYVPCNSRNYIVTSRQDAGDYHTPFLARTNGSDKQPPADIRVTGVSLFWALNQKESALRSFFPFCQKYACYNTSGKGDRDQGASNYSSDGWNGMLRENFSFGLERAVRAAAQKFGPDLPDNPALWPQFADEVSKTWMVAMGQATGWDPKNPWFCASGGDLKAQCRPVRVTIESMEYVNDALRGQNEAQQQAARQIADIERQRAIEDAKAAERLHQIQQQQAEADAQAHLWNTPGYREQQQWAHEERMMDKCAASQHCQVGNDGRIYAQQ